MLNLILAACTEGTQWPDAAIAIAGIIAAAIVGWAIFR